MIAINAMFCSVSAKKKKKKKIRSSSVQSLMLGVIISEGPGVRCAIDLVWTVAGTSTSSAIIVHPRPPLSV